MRGIWGARDGAARTRGMGACCVDLWLLPSQAPPCGISLPVTPFNACLHHWCGSFFLGMKMSVSMHFLPFSNFSSSIYYLPGRPFDCCPECNLLIPESSSAWFPPPRWLCSAWIRVLVFSCSGQLWVLSLLAFTSTYMYLEVLLVWSSNHCFLQIYDSCVFLDLKYLLAMFHHLIYEQSTI